MQKPGALPLVKPVNLLPIVMMQRVINSYLVVYITLLIDQFNAFENPFSMDSYVICGQRKASFLDKQHN